MTKISVIYGVKKEIILEANELKSAKQIGLGVELQIPILFECAKSDNDLSVCAKSNGMCASGDKCQVNEVCDFGYTHTDHMHLYKHGICVCAVPEAGQ